MKKALLALALSGCILPSITAVADDQPCVEAAYAIARRTEECTGDRELANDRYDLFYDEWKCIPTPVDDPQYEGIQQDLYGCAATISSFSCETVEEFGDDIALWVGVDPA